MTIIAFIVFIAFIVIIAIIVIMTIMAIKFVICIITIILIISLPRKNRGGGRIARCQSRCVSIVASVLHSLLLD